MKNSPNLDKRLPVNSIVLRRSFKTVQFPDKLKRFGNGFFEYLNKPTDITCEDLTQEGKTFHRQGYHWIP